MAAQPRSQYLLRQVGPGTSGLTEALSPEESQYLLRQVGPGTVRDFDIFNENMSQYLLRQVGPGTSAFRSTGTSFEVSIPSQAGRSRDPTGLRIYSYKISLNTFSGR